MSWRMTCEGFGPAYLKWITEQARGGAVTYARTRVLHALRYQGWRIMRPLSHQLAAANDD